MSIRYSVAIALLMLQFGSVAHADDKPTAEIIDTKPMILRDGASSKPVIYKKSMLVVSSKDGVAAIVFGKPIPNGVTYRYRFLPKGHNKEQIGEGRVFEKHKTTLNLILIQFVKDDGGKELIQAGPITLRWSLCDRGSGWIYVDDPTGISVLMADAKDFPKMHPKKFMK